MHKTRAVSAHRFDETLTGAGWEAPSPRQKVQYYTQVEGWIRTGHWLDVRCLPTRDVRLWGKHSHSQRAARQVPLAVDVGLDIRAVASPPREAGPVFDTSPLSWRFAGLLLTAVVWVACRGRRIFPFRRVH